MSGKVRYCTCTYRRTSTSAGVLRHGSDLTMAGEGLRRAVHSQLLVLYRITSSALSPVGAVCAVLETARAAAAAK